MSLETSEGDEMISSHVGTFIVGALFGSLIAAANLNAGQSPVDPVKQSPQYYKVRVDNDRVRVLEYHLPSGQREAMHSHPPGVVFITSDAPNHASQRLRFRGIFQRRRGSLARQNYACDGEHRNTRIYCTWDRAKTLRQYQVRVVSDFTDGDNRRFHSLTIGL